MSPIDALCFFFLVFDFLGCGAFFSISDSLAGSTSLSPDEDGDTEGGGDKCGP